MTATDDGATLGTDTSNSVIGLRFSERLPSWMGSIRVRLTLLYSILLFGLAAVVVGGIYAGLSQALDSQPISQRDRQSRVFETEAGPIIIQTEREVENELAEFEREVNTAALDKLRNYSFAALGLLFVGSLAVGWFVADMVLRPINRITGVAREIQATDLKRRINLSGPNDELRDLADTFDEMLARLDQAFEGQRRFIHETSHELRNPLAVLRTNLDVVQSDPTATVEDYREVSEVMGRTAERMTALVDDLLLYARQEAPDHREELVDAATVVTETVAEYRASAEAKSIRLLEHATPRSFVKGDPTALRRALANLLTNAIRHTPEAGRIRVASGSEAAWVWVAVEDEGPGIAEGDQDRVWQRFWRGERRRTKLGSGLGLTIVRQIIEAHGGQVQLLSEPGRGSTFVLWLPIAAGSIAPGERPPSTGEIDMSLLDEATLAAAPVE
ncbi:MAG: HAMP domain-containing histidine kinase [Acidimicrobiales bacterium]|nr:HAMP domain-containing histidine kinase [Acidimicrobiales bacterium]